MKETTDIWAMYKKSVQWNEMTLKQNLISLWFSLSFTCFVIVGNSLIIYIIEAANFAASDYFRVKICPNELG